MLRFSVDSYSVRISFFAVFEAFCGESKILTLGTTFDGSIELHLSVPS